MYNLIEYRDNYSKGFEFLWQYFYGNIDEPTLADDNKIADFTVENGDTNSFKIK